MTNLPLRTDSGRSGSGRLLWCWLAALALQACGSSQSPPADNAAQIDAAGGQLQSADGALALTVPPDALGAPVRMTVASLPADNPPTDIAPAMPEAVFELGPAGQQFAEPVDIALDLGRPALVDGQTLADLQLLVLSSGGALEILPDQVLTISPDGVSVRGTTTHFSQLSRFRMGSVRASFRLARAFRGVPFQQGFQLNFSNPSSLSGTASQTGNPTFAPSNRVTGAGTNPLAITLPSAPSGNGSINGTCVTAGNFTATSTLTLSSAVQQSLLSRAGLSGLTARPVTIRLALPLQCQVAIATDDTAQSNGATVVIPVLANDLNADGSAADAATASVVATTQPANGVLVTDSLQQFRYTPNSGFSGTDSFRYLFKDKDGSDSDPATVTITVTPAASPSPTPQPTATPAPTASPVATPTATPSPTPSPVATPSPTPASSATPTATPSPTPAPNQPPIAVDDTANAIEATAVEIDVLANDSDADGSIDVLGIQTDPANGTAVVTLSNRISYQSDVGFSGNDFLEYVIVDDDGASATALVTIAVQAAPNMAPTANDDQASTLPDTAVTIDVLANDSDPDGTLAGISIIDDPGHGSVSVINSRVEYTPNPGYTGPDSFTYRAVDDEGAASIDTATVTISVANQAPVAVDDMVAVNPDETTPIDILANDSDTDGSVTSAQLVDAPTHGSVTIQGSTISYTPDAGYSGPDSFTYRAVDDMALASTNVATVDITVLTAAGSPFDAIRFSNLLVIESHTGTRFISDRNGIGASATLVQITAQGRQDVEDIPGSLFGQRFMIDSLGNTTPQSNVAQQQPLTYMSSLQTAEVTQDPDGILNVSNLQGSRVYAPTGDHFMLSSNGQPIQSVAAPPDIVDANGDQIFLGTPNGLETEIFVPAGASHMIAFGFTDDGQLGMNGRFQLEGVIFKMPTAAMTPVPGGFSAPLFDAATIGQIQSFGGFKRPLFVGYTNEIENDTVFPGAPVPVAAGQLLQIETRALEPINLPCQAPPTGVRCAAGPNESLLVTNSSGQVGRFDANDGTFEGFYLGNGAPNFIVDSGWQATRGPDNCVVVSDSQNGLWLYDPNGNLIRTDGAGGTQDNGSDMPLTNTLDEDVRGIAFHTTNNGQTHNLYLAVGDRIVRYDYGTSGTVVLSNRTEIVIRPDASFNSLLIVGNTLYATDQGGTGQTDRIRRFDLGGADLGTIRDDLVTPYQLTELFSGELGLADFGQSSIQLLDADGSVQLTYPLDDGDSSTDDNPRGLWPLRDGNYLVSGRDGVGVSVLDRITGDLSLRDPGRNERFIGTACLP